MNKPTSGWLVFTRNLVAGFHPQIDRLDTGDLISGYCGSVGSVLHASKYFFRDTFFPLMKYVSGSGTPSSYQIFWRP